MLRLFDSMNLKTRILLLVTGLVLAGIWGLAAHVSVDLRTDIEHLVSGQLSTQVRYVADELDHELHLRAELLREIAASITVPSDADAARLQSLLALENPSHTIFPFGLLVVNRDGFIVADHPAASAARRTGTFSNGDYFHGVMLKNKQVIGPPMVFRRISLQPVIPITVPLHDTTGSFAGILFGPVPLSDPDLFGKLDKMRMGKSGEFMVVLPSENRILFATAKMRTGNLPPKGVNPIHDRRLYEGFEEPAVTTNPDGVEVIGVSRNMRNTGWVMIAYITTEEAFAPVRAFRNHAYVAAFVLSLVIASVLFFVLRRQLLPLDAAGGAMQRMTDGQEPFAPILVARDDEIGRLVGSFNRLVAERQRADSAIRELNRTLEARVGERTDQLTAINRQLEAEITERKRAEASTLKYANRLQHLARRTVNVLEVEQKRLAIELHDRVSSNLTTIGLNIAMIEKELSQVKGTEIRDRLSDCTALLEDAASTARDISSDLHPAVLDYLGLVPALEELAEKIGRSKDITVHIAGPIDKIRLPKERETALFRIAQEALLNCAKHSHATTVAIRLDRDLDRVVFSIADDGIGFDATEINRPGQSLGLGLMSMEERAEAVGGRCHIESAPGKGTTVRIEMVL